MLRELTIQEFALIERLSIEFADGLSVLTGETGAGKSIIIDALGLLLGARASSDMIRTGSQASLIEGSFDLPRSAEQLLCDWGLAETASDELIIGREIQVSGRSRCRVNGRLVTVSQLHDLGQYLVDILGQHDQQSLMHSEQHIDILDSFGDAEHQSALVDVRKAAAEFQRIHRKRVALAENESERLRRMDLLEFQIDELETAALSVDEEETLEGERRRLAHAERLQQTIGTAYSALQDGDGTQPGLLQQLAAIVSEVENAVRFDPELTDTSAMLSEGLVQLEEGSSDLRYRMEGYAADPRRLEEIETRLSRLTELKRKYGSTLEDVMAYFEDARQELDELQGAEQTSDQLENEEAGWLETYRNAAERLTECRQRCAERLEEAIQEQLRDLSLEKMQFSVRIDTDTKRVAAGGSDAIEFIAASNPGEDFKPLARIASGGEASRVMLALKSVFVHLDPRPTLIFDEVDTGVGGRTAQKIAEKLQELSRVCQVLAITHLPVVASIGEHQYSVEKQMSGQRTVVAVSQLNPEARVTEITRMLGGSDDDPISQEHARELLRKGGR